MTKIKKEAFLQLCRKVNVNVPEETLRLAVDVAYRQISHGRWQYGNPASVFMRDRLPCIRYQEGTWWHYDVVKGLWF